MAFRQLTMSHTLFTDENRLEKFKNIIIKYEINYDFAFRLRSIEGVDIVLIIDDSSSMTTPVIDREQADLSPFRELPTRWDELKHVVSIIIDLASTLDPDGVDVYFLNRPSILHVYESKQLDDVFEILPHGPTPLVRVLNEVLRRKRLQNHDRKVLILIATDGLPTNDRGESDLKTLERLLRNCRQSTTDNIYITFIACTNDLECVGYLNKFDRHIPFVDVLDDYQSERKEILRVQGKNFPFSHGDYVVKILMGSIDPWFDHLDERKVQLKHTENKPQRRLSRLNGLTREKNCIIS